MKRKVPFRESFDYVRPFETEQRIQVETINGVSTATLVEFDSSKLDLGDPAYFDLQNMLASGVKPGKAKVHNSSLIDAAEQANGLAEELSSINTETN